MADFTQQAAQLNERINNNQTALLRHMEQLIQASSTKNKDRYTTAAETFQLDIHADHIIKAAEDLLKLSRELKEAWILSSSASSGSAREGGKGVGETEGGAGLEEEIRENARVVGHALRKWCMDSGPYEPKWVDVEEEEEGEGTGAGKMDVS